LPLDWSTLHKVLRDETRKQIILNLQAAGLLTYTDLMNRLQITNTGKLNYHLKLLNDLVAKNEQGAYALTERGKAAAELLDKFPSQITGSKSLKVFDAVIIGLVGLLLTGIPVFFEFFIFTASSFIPPILFLLYLLLIPSFVMWRLTTRRINSHDLYELVKAPIIALTISYFLVLIVLFLPRLLASPPPPNTTTTTTTQTIVVVPVVSYFLFPLIPLLGVLVIEGVYRFRSR
jgi:hypothetical protein